ncbi:hypothetical protein MKW98_030468 [Papaver atlanticum]|uniref:Uncharacterized protein n=1 Tax=Papaver atlanticum TaxID=357466 RepID=A0AAD4SI62_9MAGN|nr:hypothetical protein MKW98_030468 [Papaver atlanticum]
MPRNEKKKGKSQDLLSLVAHSMVGAGAQEKAAAAKKFMMRLFSPRKATLLLVIHDKIKTLMEHSEPVLFGLSSTCVPKKLSGTNCNNGLDQWLQLQLKLLMTKSWTCSLLQKHCWYAYGHAIAVTDSFVCRGYLNDAFFDRKAGE